MTEVAGRVVGDARRERVAHRAWRQRRHQLVHVAHLPGEGGRARLEGVSREEPLAVLEVGAAPGRVDDHQVHVGRLEPLDEPADQAARLVDPAGVGGEGPTATLPRRHHHLAPLGHQHPGGGRVDVGEEDPLHAAGDQPDPGPALPGGGPGLGQARRQAGGPDPRRQRIERGEAGRDQAQEPRGAQQPLQPAPRVEEEERRREPEPPRVREEGEEHGAVEPVERTTRHLALPLVAGLLDDEVIADARGAGGHAGHAAQAAVQVDRHRPVHLDLAVAHAAQHVDAAARGVHLLAPVDPGRADREAEAAVDALVEVAAGRHLDAPHEAPGGQPALWIEPTLELAHDVDRRRGGAPRVEAGANLGRRGREGERTAQRHQRAPGSRERGHRGVRVGTRCRPRSRRPPMDPAPPSPSPAHR